MSSRNAAGFVHMNHAATLPAVLSVVLLVLVNVRARNRRLNAKILWWLRRYLAVLLRRYPKAAVQDAARVSALSTVLLLLRYRQTISNQLNVVRQRISEGGGEREVEQRRDWRSAAIVTHSIAAVGRIRGATQQLGSVVATSSSKVATAVTSGITSASERVKNTAVTVYEGRVNYVQSKLEGYIDQATSYAGDGLKVSLKDPAMPSVLMSLIDETVDKVMPDVRSTAVHLTNQVCCFRCATCDKHVALKYL